MGCQWDWNIVGYHQQLLEMCSSAHEVYPESVAFFFCNFDTCNEDPPVNWVSCWVLCFHHHCSEVIHLKMGSSENWAPTRPLQWGKMVIRHWIGGSLFWDKPPGPPGVDSQCLEVVSWYTRVYSWWCCIDSSTHINLIIVVLLFLGCLHVLAVGVIGRKWSIIIMIIPVSGECEASYPQVRMVNRKKKKTQKPP